MKRYIVSAQGDKPTAEDRLNDILDVLKDNFNFAYEGIEKIAADGDISGAIEQANALNQTIDDAIEEIARNIVD